MHVSVGRSREEAQLGLANLPAAPPVSGAQGGGLVTYCITLALVPPSFLLFCMKAPRGSGA